MEYEVPELTKEIIEQALRHNILTGAIVALHFHPGVLIINNLKNEWYEGGFSGNYDISINMTADESTLKEMSDLLFDE